MHLMRALLIGSIVLATANAATAQEQPQQQPQPSTIDATRLGLNLSRIQRELRQSASTESDKNAIKIRYTIDVYGQAPRLQFFTKEDNLQYGLVPNTAPTHGDMLYEMTP